jgi:ribosomal protein S27AE
MEHQFANINGNVISALNVAVRKFVNTKRRSGCVECNGIQFANTKKTQYCVECGGTSFANIKKDATDAPV